MYHPIHLLAFFFKGEDMISLKRHTVTYHIPFCFGYCIWWSRRVWILLSDRRRRMSLAFLGALPWNNAFCVAKNESYLVFGWKTIFRAWGGPFVRLITPSLDEMQYVAVGVAQQTDHLHQRVGMLTAVISENPGWLGYIGHCTTQLYKDYKKPLWESPSTNQDFMECHKGFDPLLTCIT